jgi:hypothetical protein
MRTILIYCIAAVILAILGVAAYHFINTFTYTRHIDLPPQLLATSTDQSSSTQSMLHDPFGQTDPSRLDPASSTLSASGWKTYTNNEVGFSISYPSDLTVKPDPLGAFALIVPKDHYFHWPLLDDVTLSVVASSSCPTLQGGLAPASSATLEDNGYTFVRQETSDVAAGNIYRELSYDMVNQGLCYHIDLLDHGANGAGLYVGDQALISRYEAQHQADLDGVVSMFMGVVDSFRIVETPAGTPENEVSPQ